MALLLEVFLVVLDSSIILQVQLVSYWVLRHQLQAEELLQHVILEMLLHLLKMSMINHYSLQQVFQHSQMSLLRPIPTHALMRVRLLQQELAILKLLMRLNGILCSH